MKEAIPKQTEPQETRRTDVNLEALDRTEYTRYILDQIKKEIGGAVQPLREEVDETRNDAIRADLAKQVADCQKAHPDFDEWKDEMGTLAKRTPGLNVQEIYDIVRMQNKTKASEMDEKYKSEEQRQAELEAKKKKAAEKEPPYGGLTPTSGKTVEVNDMTTEEAAESAFDEIFGADAK
jgi:hypothetical protein